MSTLAILGLICVAVGVAWAGGPVALVAIGAIYIVLALGLAALNDVP